MNYYSYELESMHYEEVDPMTFYRDVFPDGELAPHREKDDYKTGEYSAIAMCVSNNLNPNEKHQIKRYTITDDFDNLDYILNSEDFCFMSPISYAGKNRTSNNARYLYALCIEIDNLKVNNKRIFKPEHETHRITYNKSEKCYIEHEYVGLHSLFENFGVYYPKPTYIVASGNGVHLYYIFEKAIPLYKNIAKTLEIYKRRLTKMLWNKKVTMSYKESDIQYESLYQGFRIPGTLTKVGLKTKNKRDDRATAHKIGDKVSIEYMNSFVAEKYKMSVIYKSNLTKAQAKDLYPEWYQRRIVEGKEKKRWYCKENLYTWWLNRITEETQVGHRYYCLMMLSVYAIKCEISRDQLETDAFSLLQKFEDMTTEEENHFTEKDVLDALQIYEDKKYVTYPIKIIEKRSGLHIEKNKRNGRNIHEHVEYMNTIREYKIKNGECKMGRPIGSDKSEIIKVWRQKNPNGKKSDCIKQTGLSKPTVYKWWENDKISQDTDIDIEETEITF